MNKVQINSADVYCKIKALYDQIYDKMKAALPSELFIFGKRRIGQGYLQWDLPEGDWKSFDELDEIEKPLVKQRIREIRNRSTEVLKDAGIPEDLIDSIFFVPDEKYVYVRAAANGNYDVMLTVWGYKYPSRPITPSSVTFNSERKEKHAANVIFSDAGGSVSTREFNLIFASGRKKKMVSDDTGKFIFPEIALGHKLIVEDIVTGKTFTHIVTEGQEDYVCDVTRHFTAVVRVWRDGSPCQNGVQVHIEYGGKTFSMETDGGGKCEKDFIIVTGSPCAVRVFDAEQVQTPDADGQLLEFEFKTETPKPVIDPPVIPDEPVVSDNQTVVKFFPHVRVVDTRGCSMADYPLVLRLNGIAKSVFADDDGIVEIGEVSDGTEIRIIDGKNDSNEATIILDKGQTEYLFTVRAAESPADFYPRIRVVGQDGFIGRSYPIIVTIDGNAVPYVTEEDGVVTPGMLHSGQEMLVTDGLNQENSAMYILDASREEYIFHVPFGVVSGDMDIKVTILDRNDRPLSGGSVLLRQQGAADILAYPDTEGQFYLSKANFATERPVSLQLTLKDRSFMPVSFKLKEGETEYVVHVEKPGSFWMKLASFFVLVLVLWLIFVLLFVIADF